MATAKVACQESFDILTGLRYDASATDEQVSVVQPRQPVPPFTQKLGLLDRMISALWTPTLYAFETPGECMLPACLQRTLSLALDRVPTLAGELHNLDGTRDIFGPAQDIVIRGPGPGAWFAHDSIQADFQELKKHLFNYEMIPPSHRFKRFIDAVSAYLQGGPPAPLFAVKASYFPCGSVILMVYTNHLVADGRSSYDFIKLWSQIARGNPQSELSDARHLFVPDGNITPGTLARIGGSVPFDIQVADFPPFRACTITIPTLQMQSLKQKINDEIGQDEFVTTDDIFTAAVWRAMTRARRVTAQTCIQRSIDVRASAPLVPPNSLCNGIVSECCPPLDATALTTMPLAQVALHLRRHVRAASHPQYLQDLLNSLQITLPSKKIPPFARAWFGTDLLVSSFAKFLPAHVDFGGAPALQMTRAAYLEGHFVTYPAIHGQHLGVIGVSQDYVHRFLNDPELMSLGFVARIPPF